LSNSHLELVLIAWPQDDQKNWSPFEYNGTLLFIQSVQPHRVVRTTAVPPLAPDTDRAAIAAGTRLRAFTGPTWYRGYPETWPGEDTKASRALSKVHTVPHLPLNAFAL